MSCFSGNPVMIDIRMLFRFGARPLERDVFSAYYDVMGFENGTQTWVSVHLFRRTLISLYISRTSEWGRPLKKRTRIFNT
jgi:hypothetical protein